MTSLLILAFLGASWEPPPPKVAQALEVAPSFCVYTHGYVAGLLAIRDARRPGTALFR